MDDKLVVTDQKLLRVNVYAPTRFGQAALKASRAYYRGNWDAALAGFQEALKQNSNYDVAYIGIGKNYLMKQNYEKAMYYLRLGNDRDDYSTAYNQYRSIVMQKYFGIFMAAAVVGIGLLLYSEHRYFKKNEAQER